MALVEATMGAVRDRLRPIVLTSLAFGLGVLPLATPSGAGSHGLTVTGLPAGMAAADGTSTGGRS